MAVSSSSTTMPSKNDSSSSSMKEATTTSTLLDVSSIFGWNKTTYRHVADEFHVYHQHHFNVFLHLLTTPLGVWGALQLVLLVLGEDAGLSIIAVYTALIALTTPLFWTALLHTLFMYALVFVAPSASDVAEAYVSSSYLPLSLNNNSTTPLLVSVLAIAAGYGLQDAAHWACMEPTYMDSYMKGGNYKYKKDDDKKELSMSTKDAPQPWMLVVHSIWLLALVIDSVTMRYFFLPQLLVNRNRCVVVKTVTNRRACNDLRAWINQHVPSTCAVTTHVWPHDQKETSPQTLALEQDANILAAFRKVFDAQHYDIQPVQGMNEIYVTAVGAKKEINSDAVFYTPHTDGPYWFLPQASLYRVLVGLTPNRMVRTRFNLQHASQNQVMDMYGVVGFDYNRELHWIDHVPNQTNPERRSLLKLHFVVYPKGWHAYGKFCAMLNQNYNTWARGNFLKTLRPKGLYEFVLAWWIWLTTWTNAVFEERVGWANLVYIGLSYAAAAASVDVSNSRLVFEILTSFRHYSIYIATFAFRQPPVAHGYFMRDAKLYKTISMMHLARRLLPLVQLPQDTMGVMGAGLGFGITILATARLGMVRTYFGSELNLVEPRWIVGFPYGYIPHPMIVGQLLAFSAILAWFYARLTTETVAMIAAHMTAYSIHMVQETLTSSY